MAEVNITINGRSYDISCDNGQETRIADLAAYADHKLQQIARAAGSWDEKHLLVLTSLILADEVFQAREKSVAEPRAVRATPPVQQPQANKEEEQLVARVLADLARRIEGIAEKVQAA